MKEKAENQVPILERDHSILRKKAEVVPLSEIGTGKIKKIISDMKKALNREVDGVAIAAPQIGASLRIFVVSGRAFRIEEKNEKEPSKRKVNFPDLVFINPKITKTSKRERELPEGCLSVRWLYGKVIRADKATAEAYNEYGKKFSYGGSGLMAQIFQHEIDHLDGVLFVDKARDLEEIRPEKIKKERKPQ